MASTIWEDLKKTLKDSVAVAAEKTEEYTKIGRIRVEILNLDRTMDKTFRALGREIYSRISEGKKVDVAKDEGIQYFIDKIVGLKAAVKEKEMEIERIKTESAPQQKTEKEPDASPEKPKTPPKKTKTAAKPSSKTGSKPSRPKTTKTTKK